MKKFYLIKQIHTHERVITFIVIIISKVYINFILLLI